MTSRLVLHCKKSLAVIFTQVSTIWLPGHSGIYGNVCKLEFRGGNLKLFLIFSQKTIEKPLEGKVLVLAAFGNVSISSGNRPVALDFWVIVATTVS